MPSGAGPWGGLWWRQHLKGLCGGSVFLCFNKKIGRKICIALIPFYVVREYRFIYVLCVHVIEKCLQYPSNLISKFVSW